MGSLSQYRNLDIDWTMTPEAAVTMYLEWGNNSWHASHRPVTKGAFFHAYQICPENGDGAPLVHPGDPQGHR